MQVAAAARSAKPAMDSTQKHIKPYLGCVQLRFPATS